MCTGVSNSTFSPEASWALWEGSLVPDGLDQPCFPWASACEGIPVHSFMALGFVRWLLFYCGSLQSIGVGFVSGNLSFPFLNASVRMWGRG